MWLLDSLTTQWKKLFNRSGHIIDTVFTQMPWSIVKTTEKVFSKDTAEQITSSIHEVKEHFSELFSNIKEEDTINIATEDIPCAIISNIVYDDPFSRPKKIDIYELIEDHNSIEYCLYRDIKKWKLILWYRGTEFTELSDYISDINIILWTHEFNDRFQTSMWIYEKVCATYPDDIKVITWHSLGWSICYMIAQKKDPDRTVVFNAWSSPNPTFVIMMKDTQFQADWTKRVFTYRILGDVVSTLSVIGYTRTFRKASVNPKELHAAANFLPAEFVQAHQDGDLAKAKKEIK